MPFSLFNSCLVILPMLHYFSVQRIFFTSLIKVMLLHHYKIELSCIALSLLLFHNSIRGGGTPVPTSMVINEGNVETVTVKK